MLSTLSSIIAPKPRFAGDVRELMRYQIPGIMNKRPLFESDLYVPRPDLDENALYTRITDPRDNTPVLLTGAARSGKSTVALQLMERLDRAGHMVMCFENALHPKPQFMKPEAIQQLKETLDTTDSGKPLFLFVDEPHIIPVMEHRTGLIAANGKTQSSVTQLYQLVQQHRNLKIIGVKASGVDAWVTKNSTPELAATLETLFPPSHHVVIPPVTSLDPDVTIRMANNGLKTAGFLPLPQAAMEVLKRVAAREPLDIRVMMGVFAAIISQLGCNGDKTRPEPFPTQDLEVLPEMLLYNLRQHRL